ncbi:MAG: ABC transporter substrate-binding protein [Hyphomicrobiaceae bacterium]
MHLARLLRPRIAALGLTIAALAALTSPSSAQQRDSAIVFMQRAAKDLIDASRARSVSAFAAALQRHGDITYIGLYSLGSYRPRLDAADRSAYLAGMVRYVARYAATEAPKYPVSHVEFPTPTRRAHTGIMVDSRVHLRDGTVYDVTWVLAKYGSSYRVRDAQVLGFSAVALLQRLFVNHIEDHRGSVKALVVVLGRY